jgi:two-component system OmpR family sensor kinase
MMTTTKARTTTMDPPTTEDRPAGSGWRRSVRSARRLLGSVRVRLLLSYVALLALAAVISVFVVRQVLLVRLDDRVQDNLQQEVDEFQRLAEEGVDPETGEPLRESPNRLFTLYLERNIPGEGEELVTIPRHGQARYRYSERAQGYVIDEHQLLRRWRNLDEVERDEIDTPIGEARYVAIPVKRGDRTVGSFVVANFVEGELEEVEEAVRIVAAVAGVVLLLGTALAILATGRVLAPVRELRDGARSVSGSDMTRRIDVSGSDELAELGQTFNRMLDRLELAFSSQRGFLRDVGHELRTPITIVRGHIELLAEQDSVDAAHWRDVLMLVSDELDRIGRFVDDLSLLARSESPDFLRLETVRLDELSRELVEKARSMGDREWKLDPMTSRSVVADRQRLTQAVISLLDNAVKHTGEGDEIAVGASVNGAEARLWVRDAGPGIDPADRELLFDRFKRGRTGRRRYEGTGLGLAIVRAIAEAHGGRVEAAGGDGQGARFTLIIPVDQEQVVEPEPPTITVAR